MTHEPDVQQAELNDLLEAYEHARAVEGEVNLRDCLPRQTHPIYQEARRELVRLDLEYSWQNRCPKRLAVYLALFPDLFDDPQSAQDIAFEEYRLRVLAGENPSALDYEKLYGVNAAHWPGSDVEHANYPKTILAGNPAQEDSQETIINRANVNTPPLEWNILDGERSLSGETARALLKDDVPNSSAEVNFLLAQALTSLPGVGSHFLNFHLIAELGRGSFGCVYLARQSGLANRLVALKLTVDLQGEEQKLAQLQHTNVVPVYSAHTTKSMHAVCMPYFGPTTLGDVARRCREQAALPTSGAFVVETLRARMAEFLLQTGARASLPTGNAPAAPLKLLEKTSYVTAVLWLAERVAEGLMHAHEHGILHGDLKPANILLTEEGQPMLLDFNLATDLKVRAGLGELRVGGTLPYMSPEHLRALQGPEKSAVDARSDIYALGVILFELLTGKVPFESKRGPLAATVPTMIAERLQPPPALRPLNPAITPAVESIVHRCMAADPAERYQSVQELHEDLQRHAHDLPLKHAAEPSLRERAGKWMRRHPYLTSPTNIIFVCFVLIALLLAPGAWRAWQDWQTDRLQLAQARNDVDHAQRKREDAEKKRQSADERARGADERARDAEARVQALNRARSLHTSASVARDLMDRLTLARLRPETWPSEHAIIEKQIAACNRLLGEYQVLADADWQTRPIVAVLPDTEKESLRADVAAILYTLTEAEIVRANRLRSALSCVNPGDDASSAAAGFIMLAVNAWAQAHEAHAKRWNTQACACFPGDALPRAFLLQKAHLARSLRNDAEAGELLIQARKQPLREDVDDAYWTAASLAASGQFREAELVLAVATRQAPDHFGMRRLRGLCCQAVGELRRAEACWDTCLALKDDDWVYYCRGQVCLQLRKWPEAQRDFDAFLQKHADFRDAYLQRANAWRGQEQYLKAIADLNRAFEFVPPSPALVYLRLELMEKTNDKQGMEHDIRLLSTEPSHVEGWIYRAKLRAKDNPKTALADLERALEANRDNVDALYQKALLLADRLDRPVEAVGALNRLLIADPTHADALLKRGLLYASAGVRDVAITSVERALKRDLTAAQYYQAACIFAFTSKESAADRERVVNMLKSAMLNGYPIDQAKDDPNLPLAHLREASELIRAAPLLAPDRPK